MENHQLVFNVCAKINLARSFNDLFHVVDFINKGLQIIGEILIIVKIQLHEGILVILLL